MNNRTAKSRLTSVRRWCGGAAAAVMALGVLSPVAGAAAPAAPIVPMAAPSAASWGQAPPGDGSAAVSAVPVAVTQTGVLVGETVAQAELGRTGGCAVTMAGKVACWGTSFLGDGTANGSPVPVDVKTTGALAGRTVSRVSVGDGFSCVVTTDGGAFCWGRNTYGQLGDGTTTDRLEPVAVLKPGELAGKPVSSITAGTDHACFHAGGLVPGYPSVGRGYCWGLNSDGQLGTGVVGGQASTPQRVVLPGGDRPYWPFHNLAAGTRHTCAQVEASDYPGFVSWSTYCWGDNSLGQLGQGSTTPPRSATMLPVAFPVIPGYFWDTRSLAVGDHHTCVMPGQGEVGWSYNGSAYCWGSNSHGQLGNGTGGAGQFSATPVRVSPIFQFGLTNPDNMPPPTSGLLAAGQAHTCAVTISHAAACWGSEYWGTLGNGVKGTNLVEYPTLFANKPVAVDTTGVLNGVMVGQVAAGGNRSLALPDYPGAPRNVSVRADDGAAWVAFEPPWIWETTAPIVNYEYKLAAPNGDGVWHAFNPPTTTSPVRIGGLENELGYEVSLRAVTEVGGRASAAVRVIPLPTMGSVLFPISPNRGYDSRVAGPGGTAKPLLPGETRMIDLTGAGIPEDASAIAYNLTAVNPTTNGHLRVVPPGVDAVVTSTVNFVAGQTIANASVVRAGHRYGYLKVYNGSAAPVNFLVDTVGFYLPEMWLGAGSGNRYVTIDPVRPYDSRLDPAGPIPAGGSRLVSLMSAAPAGATAVAYNITVPDTPGPGHVRVMPGNEVSTPVSTVNWAMAGDVIANASVVKVDAVRQIRVFNGAGAPVNVVIDVMGYYLPAVGGQGMLFYPVEPGRSADSRQVGGALASGEQRALSVANAYTGAGALAQPDAVPAGAAAIAYNVTETQGTQRGHFRVFPSGTPMPGASTLNWPAAGYTRANGAQVSISPARQVTVYNSGAGTAQVIIDTLGYFK